MSENSAHAARTYRFYVADAVYGLQSFSAMNSTRIKLNRRLPGQRIQLNLWCDLKILSDFRLAIPTMLLRSNYEYRTGKVRRLSST